MRNGVSQWELANATLESPSARIYFAQAKYYRVKIPRGLPRGFLFHSAVTYSGVGSWYYKEPAVLGNSSLYTFLFYQSFTQAYFMSLLFLIAGYFVPASLARKGVKKFINDRMFRLGIPALIYIFIVNSICIKMIHPEVNLMQRLIHGLVSFSFLDWSGPLWFALAVLIFTLIYVSMKKWCDKLLSFSFTLTVKNIFLLIASITIVAFIIRLIFPIGTSVMNFQLCFFAAYIFMFLLGVIAYQKNFFDKIDFASGKKWFLIALGLGIPLWIPIVYFGVTRNPDLMSINLSLVGGWNLISFLYAFWESFFCVTIIIALIGIFKERFNTQNYLQQFLSANAFGVYVFHAPILVGVSLLFKTWILPPILKCLVVAAIALPLTLLFSWMIRKIAFFHKIFS